MSNDRDRLARGDLVIGAERYDHVGAPPGLVDALREDNLESVQPPEGPRIGEVPRELITHEQQARFLPSPRRNPWKEIQRFADRIAEVDAHQQKLAAESARIAEELRMAPAHDGDALSTWELTGRKGPKPEPTVPALERRAQELSRAIAGMDRRRGEVLAEKAAFVERRRGRLIKDAEKAAAAARTAYEQAVAAAERARSELEAVRQSGLWAHLYPVEEQHLLEVPRGIAGNQREPLVKAGLNGPVEVGRLWQLLRDDAAFLERGLSAEQRALIGPDDDPRRATWVETPEGRRRAREELDRQIAAFRADIGRDPRSREELEVWRGEHQLVPR